MTTRRTEFRSRFENWSLTHPRAYWVQADETGLVGFLHGEFSRLRNVQLEAVARASDNIIASQDRIAEKTDQLNIGAEKIADGLEGIGAAFEWGFAELIWRVEEQRLLLRQILEVLQKPLDTQSKELRMRAENAYRQGWFDDALSDFLESEKKNRYDFSIYQSLGNIYFFERKNPEKALEYYEKMAKYAKPESAYHSSLAHLHIGLIKYLQGNIVGACQATSQAIALSPLLYEAHYQHAQYCANLGRYDEALEHLEKAVNGDRYYSVKAYSEKDFNSMTGQMTSLFGRMRDEKQSIAKNKISKIEEQIRDAESKSEGLPSYLEQTKKSIDRTLELIRRVTLLDSFDAISEADRALSLFSEALSNFAQIISERIHEKTSEIEDRRLKDSHIDVKGTATEVILGLVALGGVMVFLFSAALLYMPSSIPKQSLPTLMIASVLVVIAGLGAQTTVTVRRRKASKRELRLLESDLAKLKDELSVIKNYIESLGM